jgi:hypothetical protein
MTPIFKLETLPERGDYIARPQKDKCFLGSAGFRPAFGLTFHRRGTNID